ncbi:hypothetical protein GOBAR_DD26782 [Gossypium barbadense]|nr:hypothetical protein GOBAR_DD26782 [Gossypium barbadense]
MISKIFYKFPVSTNPVKFVEMELVDDEDVETMVDLYCGNESEKNAPIHLFAELVGIEQNASDEEDGVEEPRMVAPISYVDSESTMGGIGIDLNFTPDVDMVGGEEECAGEKECGGDHWDEEVDSDADPDLDDVPDDIDAEDEGISGCSVGEQMRRIVIHNNLGPHMSLIDPDAAYVSEFPEYPEIYHAHGQAVTSDDDELISGTDGASAESLKHFITPVRMSWQRVLKSTLLLNNMSMMGTRWSAHCMSRRMSSPSYRTYLRGRCRRSLSSFSQTEGYGGIQRVVRSQAESVTRWTLGRNLTESAVEYVGLVVIAGINALTETFMLDNRRDQGEIGIGNFNNNNFSYSAYAYA